MTRNAETPPDTPETPPTPGAEESPPASASPAGGTGTGHSGPVAELGLVAAGLGLVIYLIGFVTALGGSSSLILPLLLGGGLLAGSVALPAVGGRVLVPAAVATTTGALLLLRAVVDDGSALSVGALVLSLLEAAAAVGAALMHSGVLRARPPKARKATPSSAFSGHPAGPQFPGRQYPGQPLPGTYPADAQPFPGDQWAGEHAFAQNARYGGQYGVPGYPPPPPVGAPGYDPLHARSEAPTVAVGTEAPGDTAPPPRGTRPVTEPVGSTAEPGSGYRQGAGLGTGAHRAVPDPSTTAFGSDAATHRAEPDPGTGSFRPLAGTGSYPAVPEGPASGTGLHRAPSDTGSYGAVSSGRWPVADPLAPADSDGEHTHTIPAVPDDKR